MRLADNQIGDPGLTSLAEACSKGALASLEELFLDRRHHDHPQLIAACEERGIALS